MSVGAMLYGEGLLALFLETKKDPDILRYVSLTYIFLIEISESVHKKKKQ